MITKFVTASTIDSVLAKVFAHCFNGQCGKSKRKTMPITVSCHSEENVQGITASQTLHGAASG